MSITFNNYVTQKYNPKIRRQGEDIGILFKFPYSITGFSFSSFLREKIAGTKTNFSVNIDTTNKQVLITITDTITALLLTKTYDWQFWQKDTTGFEVCLFAGEQVIGK